MLATRADQRTADLVKAHCADAEYFPLSGAIRVWRDRTIHGKGKIAVVCAGTSDIFAAEEAQVTAILDVGVAGIHRLMNNRGRLLEARCPAWWADWCRRRSSLTGSRHRRPGAPAYRPRHRATLAWKNDGTHDDQGRPD